VTPIGRTWNNEGIGWQTKQVLAQASQKGAAQTVGTSVALFLLDKNLALTRLIVWFHGN